jgi:hypothetical protein
MIGVLRFYVALGHFEMLLHHKISLKKTLVYGEIDES